MYDNSLYTASNHRRQTCEMACKTYLHDDDQNERKRGKREEDQRKRNTFPFFCESRENENNFGPVIFLRTIGRYQQHMLLSLLRFLSTYPICS